MNNQTSKLMPCYRQIVKGYISATAGFYVVLVVVTLLSAVGIVSLNGGAVGNFSVYGAASLIYMFVAGVAGVRADLRLCMQFGASRRTAMAAEVLATITAAAGIAVLNEVMSALSRVLFRLIASNVLVADLYEILYAKSDMGGTGGFALHAKSALFIFVALLALFAFGTFFTLLFWNLRGVGMVVGGIAIPVVLNLAIWLLNIANLGDAIVALFSDPVRCMACCALLALVFGVINWGLLTRANIRAAAK